MTSRAIVLAAVGAALATAPAPARAQGVASRIEAVRDGTVRMHYAARSGVCGDGENVIRDGRTTWVLPDNITYGDSRLERCDFGPLRVEVRRAGGRTTAVRVHVGGAWPAGAATDLGLVPSVEAARYFVGLAPSLERRDARYAMAAAVFSDSGAAIAPDLERLARDSKARDDIRGHAIFGLAGIDSEDANRRLRGLVTDRTLDRDRRGEAIIALMRDGIGNDDARFLIAQYPSLDGDLREKVFLAISRSDDEATRRWLLGKVTDTGESMEARRQALFWSGQGHLPTSQLVALYPRLEERALREHYTFVMSQRRDSAAVEQLIAIARSDADAHVRKQAMFWLGQSRSPRAQAFFREVLTK